jgi:hypothetical protein
MASNRVGTDTNLAVGGTYDILFVKVNGVYPEGQVTFGLYDVPMKITGLQKVAQVFLKVLLTTKGSDPFYPNRGTYFPSLAVGANLLTDTNTFLSDITDTVNDATSQTRAYMNVNTTDLSSTLDSVQILGLDNVDEGLIIYLQMATLAGELAAVALPFPEFGLPSPPNLPLS